MIYKLYTGGQPILALLELIAGICIPALMLGGVIELFGLADTYVGQDKTLSLVFGALGFFACMFVYQYIAYNLLPKLLKTKDTK